MITVKNISKSFNGTQVLKDISFGFEKGKTNLIIGKSGSGKSVLTKCIVGLFEPDEGEIFYDNRDFLALKSKEKKDLRKEMGMLFQGSALFDSQSVEENVAFPLRMFTNMLEDEILERVNFCLNRVNILNKNNLYPSELSGGMQKRVAIARAISLQPKYLFCDEPNSGLDPVTAIVIDELIKEITDEYKMTTIVITHDMNSVLEIGDNILFIDNGIKKWEGSKNEILNVKVKELHDFVYVSKFLQNIKPK
ncbi:MAG: ATP-binding cassette domain-containing protein [Flavobacteriales bacterium]|jgi:phospholipid/cholesterol/gamma-HCH transport system ATP-binding protein|nr:ATP-binding cassette domain-containing protein [Flavobacteriales bacterium]MDG1440203.1 ATP-binding cassette domain-containing protein [Flavobacteriales bacterium]MDG1798748.1 ATP-binding cassette domain-containing protein [Flavobacteriales bacterium]